MKYYVVFKGFNPGVYDNWDEVKEQTNGFPGALYKGFPTSEAASEAYRNYTGLEDHNDLIRLISGTNTSTQAQETGASFRDNPEIDHDAWAVDASCLKNPGLMEYRGVEVATGKVIFKMGPFEDGTNNVGEFLALVHAMALMAQRGEYHNIYSDSEIAIKWVKNKRHKTTLKQTPANARLHELLARANFWLQNHRYPGIIRKWNTKRWGEIPADYGRK